MPWHAPHVEDIVDNPLALMPDWAAGTLLVGAAVASGRDWGTGRRSHTSFNGLEEWLAPEATTRVDGLVSLSQGAYLSITAAGCVIALGGLVSFLRSTDNETGRP